MEMNSLVKAVSEKYDENAIIKSIIEILVKYQHLSRHTFTPQEKISFFSTLQIMISALMVKADILDTDKMEENLLLFKRAKQLFDIGEQ